MNSLIKTFSLIFISIGLLAFSAKKDGFNDCLVKFKKFKGLTLSSTDQLPETAPKFREINTKDGMETVSRIGGYRVLYNNKFDIPFVNLKVETCNESSYSKDTTTLIDGLDYLLSVSKYMDSETLHEFDVNGFKIYGFNRSTIEQGSNLGTYVMFPEENITVHFYFNNLKKDFRHFKSLKEFYSIRDQFFDNYTKHLLDCSK